MSECKFNFPPYTSIIACSIHKMFNAYPAVKGNGVFMWIPTNNRVCFSMDLAVVRDSPSYSCVAAKFNELPEIVGAQ